MRSKQGWSSVDENSAQLIEWLKKQPRGAVVEWDSDHLTVDRPWCASWVDVRVPEADEYCNNTSWSWTVIGRKEDVEDFWEFVWPHDLDYHAIFDPEPPNYWHINELVVKKGEALSPEQEIELNRVLHEGPGRTREALGAWSAEGISAALNWWAGEYAGRGDLTFSWNSDIGPSQGLLDAGEKYDEIVSGEARVYDLGGGIHASDSVMDFLVHEIPPEDAGELMDALRELFDID